VALLRQMVGRSAQCRNGSAGFFNAAHFHCGHRLAAQIVRSHVLPPLRTGRQKVVGQPERRAAVVVFDGVDDSASAL